MSAPDSLGQPAWMTASPTQAVMSALKAAGGPDAARFVGGCVRNALMGQPVDDVDIATILTPDLVTAALADAGLRAVPTGVEHGTVTAISGGRPYEITTLRRDVATDGRRAVVAFTEDWTDDAQRRDFRFNALYADAEGRVFDPTGEGVADALAGRVVFVGDPGTRIREDYLRILRFFRFLAWYGRGEVDVPALAACEALAAGMSALAAERVAKELLKLLAAPDPRRAMRLMAQAGVLTQVSPSALGLDRLDGLVSLESEALVGVDPELRLAALLQGDAVAVRAAAQALRLSNALRDRLVAAAGEAPRLAADMPAPAARAALFGMGAPTFVDRVRLAWAAEPKAHPERWRALLALARDWTAPVFPLGGDDALAAGARGRAVGEALKAVQAWWIAGDFQAEREAALERLAAVVAAAD